MSVTIFDDGGHYVFSTINGAGEAHAGALLDCLKCNPRGNPHKVAIGNAHAEGYRAGLAAADAIARLRECKP